MDELRARTRRRRRDNSLATARASADTLHDPGPSREHRRLSIYSKSWTDDRRTAFVLTQPFRLSYEEAAAVCGCPTGTIRSRGRPRPAMT